MELNCKLGLLLNPKMRNVLPVTKALKMCR